MVKNKSKIYRNLCTTVSYHIYPHFLLFHAQEILNLKMIALFIVLYAKALEKTTKYRFWLQKGVKMQTGHRIRNRDPTLKIITFSGG